MSDRYVDKYGNEYIRTSSSGPGCGPGCVFLVIVGLIMGAITVGAGYLQSKGILTEEQAENTVSNSFWLIVYGCGALVALGLLWALCMIIRDGYKHIIFLIILTIIIFAVSAIYSVL